MQSLTHVVNRDGVMYFYYEVYEPPLDRDGQPRLRTMLGFHRGSVNVPYFAGDPNLDTLRGFPRFVDLMSQLHRRWRHFTRTLLE